MDWAIVALELLALEAALVTAKGLVCVCFFWDPLTLSFRSEGEALARVVTRPNATTIWTSG